MSSDFKFDRKRIEKEKGREKKKVGGRKRTRRKKIRKKGKERGRRKKEVGERKRIRKEKIQRTEKKRKEKKRKLEGERQNKEGKKGE